LTPLAGATFHPAIQASSQNSRRLGRAVGTPDIDVAGDFHVVGAQGLSALLATTIPGLSTESATQWLVLKKGKDERIQPGRK
jgi:hypothetical protein